MRRCLIFALGLLVGLASFGLSADQWVNGYTRSDGTYVQGHYRSSPNSTVTDNFSFKGNRNPYTGEIGTNRYEDSPSSPYYNGGGRSLSPYGNSGGNSNSYGLGSSGSGFDNGLEPLNPYGDW